MDKGGVAVGLATISVVGAALLFSAEHVRTGPMNFVERHLSISPDGGDGSMEILVLVAMVTIVVVGRAAAGDEIKRVQFMDAQTRRWFIAMSVGVALFVLGIALHYVP